MPVTSQWLQIALLYFSVVLLHIFLAKKNRVIFFKSDFAKLNLAWEMSRGLSQLSICKSFVYREF